MAQPGYRQHSLSISSSGGASSEDDAGDSGFWSSTITSTSPASVSTSVFSSCSPLAGSSSSAPWQRRRQRAGTIESVLDTLSNTQIAGGHGPSGDQPHPTTPHSAENAGSPVTLSDSASEADRDGDRTSSESEIDEDDVHLQPGVVAEEAGPSTPPWQKFRPKLLFSRTQERLSGIPRFASFARPKLDRRSATEDASLTPPVIPSSSPRLRNKRLSKLKERFATRSAPTSPGYSPSTSTDRLGFFRSRPNSIFVTQRSSQLSPSPSTFFPAPSFVHSSGLASSSASYYVPALDSLSVSQALETNVAPAIDAVRPSNHFDAILPRELRLRIFKAVVQTSIDEHEAVRASGSWSVAHARDDRWVGEAGGLRELIRLTSVCREWRDLIYDGPLWADISLAKSLGNDTLMPAGLHRLFEHTGTSTRKLDLRGFSNIQGSDIPALTSACTSHEGVTNLTFVDLTGCRSVSTKGLHFLIAQSPSIEVLRMQGLPAVVSSTCDVIIAGAVDDLKELDVSLCRNVLAAAILDICQPGLEKLYAAKIPSMDTLTVAQVPSRFPHLAILDIGCSRTLTDEAFQSWTVEAQWPLRHLRLSGCTRLTDQACVFLAGKVDKLEVLEMASIGMLLRDVGMLKLLESLSHLRKIDLEDAVRLSDRVLPAIHAAAGWRPQVSRSRPAVDSGLQHAVLTNMPELTEQGLLRFIRNAPRMVKFECSNSVHVSDDCLKAFMLHIRRDKIQGAELTAVDCRTISRSVLRGERVVVNTSVTIERSPCSACIDVQVATGHRRLCKSAF